MSASLQQMPATVANILGNQTGKIDGLGKSRAQVFLFNDYVLKIRPADGWDTIDVKVLQWLDGKAPAPQVAAHDTHSGKRTVQT